MSASIVGRTTILRAFYRATTTARISRPTARPSIPSNSMPLCPTLRLLRRELSSLQPLHSSIAAACLVSKLPNLAASSSEDQSPSPPSETRSKAETTSALERQDGLQQNWSRDRYGGTK